MGERIELEDKGTKSDEALSIACQRNSKKVIVGGEHLLEGK